MEIILQYSNKPSEMCRTAIPAHPCFISIGDLFLMSVIYKTDKYRPRRSYAKKSRGRDRFSVGVEKSSGLFELRVFVPTF